MHFSLFGMPASCTHYISYVGIEHIIHNLLFRIIHIYTIKDLSVVVVGVVVGVSVYHK